MTPLPLNDLFKIAPGPVPLLLFVRMALAVGIPLVGFTLAGQPLAAVAGGATAMFVNLCDAGSTRRGRVGMMLLGLLAIAAGGVVGDKLGGSAGVDELLVTASAFVAAWVSNSQPGLAAVARFGAVATAAGVVTTAAGVVATAAGVGLQIANPLAVGAIVAGGLWAIGRRPARALPSAPRWRRQRRC